LSGEKRQALIDFGDNGIAIHEIRFWGMGFLIHCLPSPCVQLTDILGGLTARAGSLAIEHAARTRLLFDLWMQDHRHRLAGRNPCGIREFKL